MLYDMFSPITIFSWSNSAQLYCSACILLSNMKWKPTIFFWTFLEVRFYFLCVCVGLVCVSDHWTNKNMVYWCVQTTDNTVAVYGSKKRLWNDISHNKTPAHTEREREWAITLCLSTPSLFFGDLSQQEVKRSANRKQAVLSPRSLHAVSSMVDYHFYDLAFYYHWHPLLDIYSEPEDCNCWHRGSVCVNCCASQCKVIQHAVDSSQHTIKAVNLCFFFFISSPARGEFYVSLCVFISAFLCARHTSQSALQK